MFRTENVYIMFSDDSFIVSYKNHMLKRFKIDNHEECVPKKSIEKFYNLHTRKKEDRLITVGVVESNYKNIPYLSVFQNVFNNLEKNIYEFKKFIYSELGVPRVFKPEFCVIISDGSIYCEMNCIATFLSMCHADKICMFSESAILSEKKEPFFTLTKSYKLLTLTLIHEATLDIKYFDKNFENIDEINKNIDCMSKDFKNIKIPVLLFGDNIEYYSKLGTVISKEEGMNNIKILIDSTKIKIINFNNTDRELKVIAKNTRFTPFQDVKIFL